jgi:hypothetical protein
MHRRPIPFEGADTGKAYLIAKPMAPSVAVTKRWYKSLQQQQSKTRNWLPLSLIKHSGVHERSSERTAIRESNDHFAAGYLTAEPTTLEAEKKRRCVGGVMGDMERLRARNKIIVQRRTNFSYGSELLLLEIYHEVEKICNFNSVPRQTRASRQARFRWIIYTSITKRLAKWSLNCFTVTTRAICLTEHRLTSMYYSAAHSTDNGLCLF